MIRPGRGDITTTRSDRYTASGIEWVTNTTLVPVSAQMRSSSACMCSRVISSRAPNGSSISSSGGWAARALAMATRCCIPPDSCHGRCSAKSPSLTSCSISIARCRRRRLVPALQLQRQLDVLDHGAPVEQPGLLEGHAVLLVEPGLGGRLAVDPDVAGRRLDEVGDQPQQRRLAAPRRPDQADELAGRDGEVDVDERVDLAGRAGVEHLAGARRPRPRARRSLIAAPATGGRLPRRPPSRTPAPRPDHRQAEQRPRRAARCTSWPDRRTPAGRTR